MTTDGNQDHAASSLHLREEGQSAEKRDSNAHSIGAQINMNKFSSQVGGHNGLIMQQIPCEMLPDEELTQMEEEIDRITNTDLN